MRYVLGEQGMRRFKRLCQVTTRSGSLDGVASGMADPREFAAPFSVRWAQSVSTAGAWIIWLPSASLVVIGDETADPSADLTAASGYPDGWFVLPFLTAASGGAVYLNIHQSATGGSANLAAAPDEAEEGETVTPVLVASAGVASASGERIVRQYVTSTVVIGTSPGDYWETHGGPDTCAASAEGIKIGSISIYEVTS